MTIPDYQSIMLPLLQLAGDGQEHIIGDAVEKLAEYFQLTDEDRREPLPSGQQPRFDNRTHWARTYLKQAGLLESTGRGRFRISRRGIDVLNTRPDFINVAFLRQFEEFQTFQSRAHRNNQIEHEQSPIESTETPEEQLESSYLALRRGLAQELLQRIMQCSPRFFERLVVELLVAMGYGGSLQEAGEIIGKSGDGGIDGIIKEDRLGLDVLYVQAKRWDNAVVGRPDVQKFAGSLQGERARKGVFITTSTFSKEARDYVERIDSKIVLIDGEQLAQYMIDFGIGVNEGKTYTIKRIDTDYFDEQE
jgi:restriction system protein